jgi:cation:H+ antiporter
MLTVLLLFAGFALLTLGGESLVRGSSRLAAMFGISPLVIGLTVVAFGTSAPELAVSVISAYAGKGDLAIGNVVGSNICNVLLILGLSALVAPLVVNQQLVRLDVPLVIIASLLIVPFGLDGRIGRLEGGILFAGIIVYTVYVIRKSRSDEKQNRQEYERAFGRDEPQTLKGGVVSAALIVAGIAMLVLGSHWLVEAATATARYFGVTELVIGLTIVALGTSLPELATSVVASLRGERDIAVGNVVGSNLFNLMSVLGLSSLVAPDGIPVPAAAMHFDIPVMIAVAVACLPVLFVNYQISRWNGAMFLGFYLAYIIDLVFTATGHDAQAGFRHALLWFAIPITSVALLVVTVKALRNGNPPAGQS